MANSPQEVAKTQGSLYQLRYFPAGQATKNTENW